MGLADVGSVPELVQVQVPGGMARMEGEKEEHPPPFPLPGRQRKSPDGRL